MGTNISVHLYMIATVTFFSLLHIIFWVLTCLFLLLKAKCDHFHHVCTNGFAPWWWRWSRRAISLLTAYQILSAKFIENSTWQRCDFKLQYNTCRRRMKVFSALPDHIVIISFQMVDHIWRLVCSSLLYLFFFSFRFVFLLCRQRKFQALLPPENKTTYQSFGTRIWPHLWP